MHATSPPHLEEHDLVLEPPLKPPPPPLCPPPPPPPPPPPLCDYATGRIISKTQMKYHTIFLFMGLTIILEIFFINKKVQFFVYQQKLVTVKQKMLINYLAQYIQSHSSFVAVSLILFLIFIRLIWWILMIEKQGVFSMNFHIFRNINYVKFDLFNLLQPFLKSKDSIFLQLMQSSSPGELQPNDTISLLTSVIFMLTHIPFIESGNAPIIILIYLIFQQLFMTFTIFNFNFRNTACTTFISNMPLYFSLIRFLSLFYSVYSFPVENHSFAEAFNYATQIFVQVMKLHLLLPYAMQSQYREFPTNASFFVRNFFSQAFKFSFFPAFLTFPQYCQIYLHFLLLNQRESHVLFLGKYTICQLSICHYLFFAI